MSPDHPRPTACIRRDHSVWTTCSCEACTLWRRRMNKLSHAGAYQRVSSETAWARIDELLAQGITPAWISTAAGLRPTRVWQAMHRRNQTGVPPKFGPSIASAIVNANIDDGRQGSRPAVGTRRRLRALAVNGWSLQAVREHTGIPENTLSALRRDTVQHVRPQVWVAVRDLYDRVGDQDGGSDLTATTAANKGWLGPAAWDDPETDPDPTDLPAAPVDDVVIERILAGEVVPTTRAERCAVVAAWQESGRSLKELVRVTGWQPYRYMQEAS